MADGCQQLTICQTGDVLSLAEANTATLLASGPCKQRWLWSNLKSRFALRPSDGIIKPVVAPEDLSSNNKGWRAEDAKLTSCSRFGI